MPISEKDNIYKITMKRDVLCLMMAYPEHIKDVVKNDDERVYLVLKSGNKILYDDMRNKSGAEKLSNPDLQDMMEQIYPLTPVKNLLKGDFDPGRSRVYSLFSEVYGSSRKDIENKLVNSNFSNCRFNSSNSAVESLNSAMKELILLSKGNAKIGSCIFPVSGTYNYRLIAGTNQLSPHSYGIAIDLSVNKMDYWKWATRAEGDKRINNYPSEIAEVFEKNNFIWGGKWAHFDIMHFEYRPEIILKARYFKDEPTMGKEWYEGVSLEDDYIKNSIEKINQTLKR
ncbi:MAG: M15 family metallopeptidase [Solirubrobacterales bacterium]